MPDKPSILVLDIETAPAEAYIWRLWDENVGLDQLKTPSRIIAVGAKFVGESTLYYADEYDGRDVMLKLAHDLIERSDAVVTYNGDKFDLPKLTGEFLLEGIQLPPPVASIDIIKTVKKLGLMSSRLAYVLKHYNLGSKGKTDFTLWRRFVEGDQTARPEMKRYNLRDVKRTESLYKLIRPAIKTHPTLFRGVGKCGVCGHPAQHRGYRYTKAFKIERLACLNRECGSWPDGKRTKR